MGTHGGRVGTNGGQYLGDDGLQLLVVGQAVVLQPLLQHAHLLLQVPPGALALSQLTGGLKRSGNMLTNQPKFAHGIAIAKEKSQRPTWGSKAMRKSNAVGQANVRGALNSPIMVSQI